MGLPDPPTLLMGSSEGPPADTASDFKRTLERRALKIIADAGAQLGGTIKTDPRLVYVVRSAYMTGYFHGLAAEAAETEAGALT